MAAATCPGVTPIDVPALEAVVGGNMYTKVVDTLATPVPGWKDMSCTSRGMWVGTAAGSAAAYLGGRKSARVGGAIAPWAGALATTSYIEGCQKEQGQQPK